jgi:hypothetical protein
MTDDEIRDCISILEQQIKRRNQPKLWDLIEEAEAILDGRGTVLNRTQVEHDLERELLLL